MWYIEREGRRGSSDLEGGKERRREIEVGREGKRGRKEEQLLIVW